jgi:hypothetical protein
MYEGSNPILTSLLGLPQYPVLKADAFIFSIRGLPPDLSDRLRAWAQLFENAAGHNWLALSELDLFNWEAKTKLTLAVPAADVPHFLDEHSDDVQRQRSIPATGGPAIQELDWQPSYADAVGSRFMNDVITKAVTEYGSTDRARLVYWIA